jgi:hypothetical protein
MGTWPERDQLHAGEAYCADGHKTREGVTKRNYPTRFAARKALLRRLVLDWVEMGTYPCTSGNVLHYHFGHSHAPAALGELESPPAPPLRLQRQAPVL